MITCNIVSISICNCNKSCRRICCSRRIKWNFTDLLIHSLTFIEPSIRCHRELKTTIVKSILAVGSNEIRADEDHFCLTDRTYTKSCACSKTNRWDICCGIWKRSNDLWRERSNVITASDVKRIRCDLKVVCIGCRIDSISFVPITFARNESKWSAVRVRIIVGTDNCTFGNDRICSVVDIDVIRKGNVIRRAFIERNNMDLLLDVV